ncbi:membrane protein insertion efficiency factor YidD [Xanthobacter versatilis]|uniref:membrane protein insertion efficiency factor YidD n=1 Tax=Xanthobacter autotrophicus (strain ATCC BAA-1158 / Py2) TaxID=78245 RepID=UPI00372C1C50
MDGERAGGGPVDANAARSGLRAIIGRLPRHALRLPILFYRYTLSSFMGRQCRYLPTCSEYAEEAVMRHGALAGSVMATARICRCNPWGGHGYDPVPSCLPAEARWYRFWRYGVWRMPKGPDEA